MNRIVIENPIASNGEPFASTLYYAIDSDPKGAIFPVFSEEEGLVYAVFADTMENAEEG